MKRPKIKSKYPFGGLINQGVTGLASAFGADEKTAQMIGSGIATATGFIPGFQDNLLQGGDFIGDVAATSKNRDIQNIGKVASTAGQIAGMFPYGGMNMIPNAELEKEEVMQYPNGNTTQVNGPSHETGGIPVNIPSGTKIYSDRLKVPGSKKTFAKVAETFKTGGEMKIMENEKASPLSKRTAMLKMQIKQMNLDNLFNSQEQLKQDKVKSYAKKMGIEFPQKQHQMSNGTMMNDSEMYRNGGLKRSEDYGSKEKPYPSVKVNDFAGSNRSYPIPTKADAIDALRLAGLHGRSDVRSKVFSKYPELKHKFGGLQLPKYFNGGNSPDWEENIGGINKGEQFSSLPFSEIPSYTSQLQNDYTPDWERNIGGYDTPENTQQYQSEPQLTNIIPQNNAGSRPYSRDWTPYKKVGTEIGMGLLGNAGSLYDLGISRFGKKYDKVDYGQITPTLPDYRQSLLDADMRARTTEEGLRNVTGGASGQYLTNRIASQSGLIRDKARIRETGEGRKSAILNEVAARNQAIKQQQIESNLASKTRSEDIARQAVGDIGRNVMQQRRDYRGTEMDSEMGDLITKGMRDPETKKAILEFLRKR